jgi:predicted secreted protein
MAEHQLSDGDNGAVVDARVGDVIEVQLGEMVSGGYRWSLEGAEATVLQPVVPEYEFAAGKVGGRSVAHFRFTVKQSGKSAIRLEYKRPWEKTEEPLKCYEVIVVAK